MSDKIVRFNKNHRKKQRYKANSVRKSKKRIPVSSIVFVLILGIALFFAFREMRNSDTSDTPISTRNPYNSQIIVTGKTVNYDNKVAPPEKDDIWVMYQGLSGPDKWVYDMFLDLVENRDK